MYLRKKILMLKTRKLEGLKRHIIVCMASSSKCCDTVSGNAAIEYLKNRIKYYELHDSHLVTRAACLGVCVSGPIMVVYPEGVWYHSFNFEVIDEIIISHFIHGKIMDKYVFSRALKSEASVGI